MSEQACARLGSGVSPGYAKVGLNLFAFVACLVVKVGVFSFVVSDRIYIILYKQVFPNYWPPHPLKSYLKFF